MSKSEKSGDVSKGKGAKRQKKKDKGDIKDALDIVAQSSSERSAATMSTKVGVDVNGKKSKKRKREEVAEVSAGASVIHNSAEDYKKPKKRKATKTGGDAGSVVVDAKKIVWKDELASATSGGSEKMAKNAKKKSKREKKIQDADASEADHHDSAGANEGSKAVRIQEQPPSAIGNVEDGSYEYQDSSEHKARFIVFIGQLPYTASVEAVQRHFEKLSPASIRLPTRVEDPTKNKGFAFLEFEAYDRMKTCLQLYHRTMFDDGISPPRRIKVELTAGGGGSNEQRKEKIKVKNEKLTEERRRRAINEAQRKNKTETKEKFADAKGYGRKNKKEQRGTRVDEQLQQNAARIAIPSTVAAVSHNGMHPDRLARLM